MKIFRVGGGGREAESRLGSRERKKPVAIWGIKSWSFKEAKYWVFNSLETVKYYFSTHSQTPNIIWNGQRV